MSGGLWDAGAGISVGGRHIANWLIGQVRDKNQTEEKIRDYAKQIGANEDEFLEAYLEVPSMEAEHFQQVAQVIFTLTNQLSTMAYQNVQQARFISDRRQALDAVKLSEERFKKLFDNVDSVAVQGYDRDRRVIYWNNASEKIYGYKQKEAIGVHLENLIIPPDMRPHVVEAIRQYAEEGKPIPAGELHLMRKDGTSVPVYSSHVMQTTGKGDIELFCLDVDLTELDIVRKELISAKDKAEASSKAKSEFLANMSHEIRTPLNGILGMLQLLETTATSDEQKEYLLGAIKSSKRLTRLLSDILDLSKIESRQTAIYQNEFDMEEVVRSVAESFSISIKENGLSFETVLDSSIPRRLIGDETRLRQILFNIVGNAIKFTPSGKIEVDLSLLSYRGDNTCHVLLAVKDTGIGIPDDKLKDVLEPFVQVDGSYIRSRQGAGLGLAIVRRLVALLGGNICIDSQIGTGTTFYVSLKFQCAAENSAAKDELLFLPTKRTSLSYDILVVEDEQINRIVTCKILNKIGCKTSMAVDGQNALEMLSCYDYDLILMDIQMPVMDGVAATKAIRSLSKFHSKSNIPIIAMTAHAMLGDRESFLAAGMDDYVAKPFNNKELIEAIIRVMSKKI
jgi:PAS domain S-box-containing protein